MNLIGQLPEVPLDIIGDVHGELEALRLLLRQLGYRDDGSHPDKRLLVFVGDLVDRGPDSLGVLDLVMKLVDAGHAQCLLGNHELNLLLHEERVDNRWWNGSAGDSQNDRVAEADKERYRKFLASLPLVLERQGGPTPIRIVHAAWDDESVTRLKLDAGSFPTIKEMHDQFKDEIKAQWNNGTDNTAKWDEEHELYAETNPGLSDKLPCPGFLDVHARKDSELQMKNPVKLITSGFELPVHNRKLFKAGHKWRFVERSAWWDTYDDKTPVIVGHYWRYFDKDPTFIERENGPDLFKGTDALGWLGKNQNVYCVDLGVGGRSSNPDCTYNFNLAALRVPEWQVIFDHRRSIGPPNSAIQRLDDAVSIAAEAHYGRKDKAGAPYLLHPLRMMLRMKSEAAMIAAVLHDVVEDSEWTLEQLRDRGFSEEVLQAIDCLTHRNGESYEEFIKRAQHNPIARQVKIADLEDNMNILRIGEITARDWERLAQYRRSWTVLMATEDG